MPTLTYLHFTGPGDAAAICASRRLHLSRIVTGAVFAAPLGGTDVPEVQRTGLGAGVRTHAVWFRSDVPPDVVYPEEAIWHRHAALPIHPIAILSAPVAARFLDGSAPIPDDGLFPAAVAVPCGREVRS